MTGITLAEIEQMHAGKVVTPTEFTEASRVIAKLEGWTHEPEDVAEELGIILATPHYVVIDRKIWKCEECDVWCKHVDLKDGYCSGCHPGEPED